MQRTLSMKIVHPSAKSDETGEASIGKVAKVPTEPSRPMRRQASVTKGLLTLSDYKRWAERIRGSWKP